MLASPAGLRKSFGDTMEDIKLGIIGGSGIYDIDGVQNGQWISLDTPFGAPSDKIFTGVLKALM